MAGTSYDPKDIRKLAKRIAGLIAEDSSLADSAVAGFAARRKCPPNKLCCFNGYRCPSNFWCEDGFRCTGGHSAVQF